MQTADRRPQTAALSAEKNVQKADPRHLDLRCRAALTILFFMGIMSAQGQAPVACPTVPPTTPNADPPTFTVGNYANSGFLVRFGYRSNANALVSWATTVNANTQETVIVLPNNADRIETIRVYCPGSNTNTILFLSAVNANPNCANPNSGPQVRSACGYSFCFTWSGATCTIPLEQNCLDDGSLRITETPCQ